MAMSRNIVATRKLNEKNKARLRSTGDTEFGFIKGRLSHINKDEKRQLTAADAYDISLRERVENDIAEKGAGTINPFTGMPEYRQVGGATVDWRSQPWYAAMDADMQGLYDMHQAGEITTAEWDEALSSSGYSGPPDAPIPNENVLTYNIGEGGNNYTPYGSGEMPTGNLTYDQLTDVAGQGDINTYLQKAFGATPGQDYSMYFQDLTRGAGTADDPFDFLERGFETQKKELRLQADRAEGTLGATTTRAAGGARQAARTAQSRAGFATQGSVTGQMAGQLRDIGQDFRAGQKAIGEDYGLAREKALTSYQQDVFGEERRITDRFYDMIGTLTQAGEWSSVPIKKKGDTVIPDYVPENDPDDILDLKLNMGNVGLSDIRLKEDINYIGTSLSGLNIYRFKYKDQDGVYEGVMSNEIPSSAVIKGSDGYDRVDYNMIDVDFKRIK